MKDLYFLIYEEIQGCKEEIWDEVAVAIVVQESKHYFI